MDLCMNSVDSGSEPPKVLAFYLASYVAAFPLTGFMLIDLSSIGFGLAPSYPIMAALMMAWFAQPGHIKKRLLRACWAALAFLALAIMSILQSAAIPPGAADFADKSPWVYSFTQCIYLTWAIAGFVVLCQLFSAYPSLRSRVLRWHVIVACFACFWGLYQWVAYFFDWPYITWFNNSPYRANLFDQTFMGLKRVNSTMLEPSEFALYLLSVIPLLFLPVSDCQRFISNRFRIAALILTTTLFFMTTSLSGYFCFVAFLVVFLATGRRWKDKRLIFAVGACFACFVLAAAVFTMAGSDNSLRQVMIERAAGAGDSPDSSVLERAESVIAGIAMFWANPIIGVGEGNFGFFYDQFSNAQNINALPRVYALLPRILAEHGVVGLVMFSLILYNMFKNRRPQTSATMQLLLKFAIATCFLDMFISMAEMDHLFVWVLGAILASLNEPAIPRLKSQATVGSPSPAALGASS
jgi:hypothetical protein